MDDATTTGRENDRKLVEGCLLGDEESLCGLLAFVLDATTRTMESTPSRLGMMHFLLRSVVEVTVRLKEFEPRVELATWVEEVVAGIRRDPSSPDEAETAAFATLLWWEMWNLGRTATSPRSRLRSHLEALLGDELKVVVLSTFLTCEQVARILGTTPEQVAARLQRARERCVFDPTLAELLSTERSD
jgi:hypothetical protein